MTAVIQIDNSTLLLPASQPANQKNRQTVRLIFFF